jgi:triphosphoribosyl-dephospho-CoA synthase
MVTGVAMIAAHVRERRSPLLAQAVRRACVRALWYELVTFPKPGLVSLEDNGSHGDMAAVHFWRSMLALRGYFAEIARAGAEGSEFDRLRALGIEAERRMLRATGGVNTHRGAIFNLGLLAAAAGWRASEGGPTGSVGSIVRQVWGHSLAQHRRDPRSHGARVAREHGAGGALLEAQSGFASVYRVALPAYREALARTGSASCARVQAFFALLAAVDDSNLLHRGGVEGLRFAQDGARDFLEQGGVHRSGWWGRAHTLHKAFVARNLSPGGSADLLAATVLLHELEPSRP